MIRRMLRRTALSVAVFAGSLAVLGKANLVCGADAPLGAAAQAVKGETYYTQFSLYYDDFAHETTNYRTRTLVPINTPVTFVAVRTSTAGVKGERVALQWPEIVVKLPEGRELRIRNVKKYSGEELEGIFSRTLGKAKVDLGSFTENERTAILEGRVQPGMSKAAVLRAMGYPPKHQTPSLSGNEWTYWRNRVVSFVVRFSDDKVVSTR